MLYLSSLPSSHFCSLSLSLCIHTLACHFVPLVFALITLLFSLSMYTYFSSSCRTSRLCPHYTSAPSLCIHTLGVMLYLSSLPSSYFCSLSMYTYFSSSCRTSRLCPHHTSVLSLSMYTYFRCHVVPLVSALITLLLSLSMYTYFSSSCRTSRLCPHLTSVLSLYVYIL